MLRDVTTITATFYPIRSLFCGDIQLIMNVMGLQGTSSTCPCYRCIIKLANLRNRQTFDGAENRIEERIDAQALRVQAGSTVKEMKKLSQQNESVIESRIWKLGFNQICVPILHVILGITKKLFDVMIAEPQDQDDTCPQRADLKSAFDVLDYLVASRTKKKNSRCQVETD